MRIVVCLPEAYSCYQNIRDFSKYIGENDYFFTNFDGTQMRNWSKTYTNYLKKRKFYLSSDNKPRPPYSLRHYYATQRLLEGVNVYDLAKNMGTSVKQIEKHYGHILSTQKTEELVQGARKSVYQWNEEYRAIFGEDAPFFMGMNAKAKRYTISPKKDFSEQWKEMLEDIAKREKPIETEEDRRKYMDFMNRYLASFDNKKK